MRRAVKTSPVGVGLLLLLLASCGVAPSNARLVEAAKQESSWSLCNLYSQTSSPLTARLAIEAELVSRGEKSCSGIQIGAVSMTLLGKKQFQRTPSPIIASTNTTMNQGVVDCSAFPSSSAAQRYFLAAGGPAKDPHNLDGDGDGLACEWAATAKKSFSYRPPIYRAPAYSSGRTCHRGPRGGTYTITASGNKNYGGC